MILLHALLAVNVLVFLVGSRRLAARAAREPAGCLARRRLGHGVLPGVLRLDRGLPDTGPRALPHCQGPRGAGRHPRRLLALLQAQLTGFMPAPFGPWIFWALVDLAPVLAMTAFHRDAQPTATWSWLLALPAGYVLVYGPLLALQVTGNFAWLPDFSGLCCFLLSRACLAHAPRAWSRQAAGTGPWSLTLVLLAAVAGAYRIGTLTDYLHDPHLMSVSLFELLIMLAAVALVAPDAARAATPALPPYADAMAG